MTKKGLWRHNELLMNLIVYHEPSLIIYAHRHLDVEVCDCLLYLMFERKYKSKNFDRNRWNEMIDVDDTIEEFWLKEHFSYRFFDVFILSDVLITEFLNNV